MKIEAKTYKNYVWIYPYPVPECPKLDGLLCFFNEKVDIYEEGDKLVRPRTPWS